MYRELSAFSSKSTVHILPLSCCLYFWIRSELCSSLYSLEIKRNRESSAADTFAFMTIFLVHRLSWVDAMPYWGNEFLCSSQSLGLGGSYPQADLNSHTTYSETRRKRNSQILLESALLLSSQWSADPGTAKGFSLVWKHPIGQGFKT